MLRTIFAFVARTTSAKRKSSTWLIAPMPGICVLFKTPSTSRKIMRIAFDGTNDVAGEGDADIDCDQEASDNDEEAEWSTGE